MRLINADEVKTKAKKRCDNCKGKPHFCKNCPVSSFVEIIDNAPTVDALPTPNWYKVYEDVKATFERPQGEWITNYTSQFFNPGRSCSLCGKIVEFSENYCPQCGAKMKGVNNA